MILLGFFLYCNQLCSTTYPIIYIIGIMEILLGLGFLWPSVRRISSLLTLAFLIAVLPSNIYAALNSVDFGGNINDPGYLFFRIPLQVFLLWWVWFMAVRGDIRRLPIADDTL